MKIHNYISAAVHEPIILWYDFFNHYLPHIRSDFENFITKSQVTNQDIILVPLVFNAGSLTNHTFQICYFPFIFIYAKNRTCFQYVRFLVCIHRKSGGLCNKRSTFTGDRVVMDSETTFQASTLLG